MAEEGATETGANYKGVSDVRMNDKGVTETPITYAVSSPFVSLSLHRHIGKVTVTLHVLM